MNLIVGIALNNVIGNGLTIPWHYPEDLKWFKAQTLDGVLIMGRKTFESLPKKRLPRREIIVVSRQHEPFPNRVTSLEAACYLASRWTDKQAWVVGGAEIYRAALEKDLIQKAYITRIPEEPLLDETSVLFPFEASARTFTDRLWGAFDLKTAYANTQDPRLMHAIYQRCP